MCQNFRKYEKVCQKLRKCAKDDLVELTTDKATFNLPSPCSGVLTEVLMPEGSTANVGDTLGLIQES